MKLKHRHVEYNEIDDHDLDQFVKQVYNLRYKIRDGSWGSYYEFVPTQECGNDSKHSFKVDIINEGDLNKYDLEIINRIRNGHEIHVGENYHLFQALCLDGHIPPGDYLVVVSW